MDKLLIAQKFSKSLSSYNQEARAQKKIIKQLLSLFEKQKKSTFNHILEFGIGTGLLTKEINNRLSYNKLYLNDLSTYFTDFVSAQYSQKELEKIDFIEGDIESILIPKNCDLIISSSTEQWVENKADFYKKIQSSLHKNGLFAFSSFGPDNLKQVRKATGKSLKYYDLESNKHELSKYFKILEAQEERISLNFDSSLEILTHLKKTGVNALSRDNWTRKSVKEIMQKIEQICKNGEQLEVTYHPLYFILMKK